MNDLAFSTEARRIGRELALRFMLVNGSLVLCLFIVGIVLLFIEDDWMRVSVGIVVVVCAFLLWWIFVRPFRSVPAPSCPCCGCLAVIEEMDERWYLTCPQCKLREDTTLRVNEDV